MPPKAVSVALKNIPVAVPVCPATLLIVYAIESGLNEPLPADEAANEEVNLFISVVPLNAFIGGANAVIFPSSESVNRFTRPCVSNRATLLPATALPLT